MINAYTKFFKNYVDFSSKTDRTDFWLAYLMNVLVILGLAIVATILGIFISLFDKGDIPAMPSVLGVLLGLIFLILFIYSLAVIIPSISITIRRLQDAGYHWAFFFIQFIPVVGSVALLVLLCMPTSEHGENIFNHHEQSAPVDLEKWYKLKEDGVITPEEYEAKKKEFL